MSTALPIAPGALTGVREEQRRAGSGFELVGPQWLAQLLDGGASTPKPILLEAHFSSFDHPLDPDRPPKRHIPGAIQIHPSYLEAGVRQEKYYPFYECPDDGNIQLGPHLIELLERLGIAPDSHVVIYGTEPDGAMAAARLAWGLLYAGVARVSVLDGGLDSWISDGGATANSVKTVSDVLKTPQSTPLPTKWSFRPEYLAITADVREMVRSGGSRQSRLVDVRRRGEWDGTLTNYYRFYSQAGHIPTAVHQGNWDNFLDAQTNQLGPHLDAVAARWRRQGIIDAGVEAGETTLVFYCGTGWRSSIAFLVAHLLGFRARNYDDGFYGWSWDEANEVATGEQ